MFCSFQLFGVKNTQELLGSEQVDVPELSKIIDVVLTFTFCFL